MCGGISPAVVQLPRGCGSAWPAGAAAQQPDTAANTGLQAALGAAAGSPDRSGSGGPSGAVQGATAAPAPVGKTAPAAAGHDHGGHSHGGTAAPLGPPRINIPAGAAVPGLATPGKGADGEYEFPKPGDVRDRAKAQAYLDTIRQGVAQFADVNDAKAAGYTRGSRHGTPEDHIYHYKGGVPGDLSRPDALMFKEVPGQRPELIGVHYSSATDFGAGYKHSHPGQPKVFQHVWIDRTLDAGAFGNIQGEV